jgi:hypothetical protein
MPAATPSPPPDASGTQRGLVNLAAQAFAGVKTFLAGIVTTLVSAGAGTLTLRSDKGAAGTDVIAEVRSTVNRAGISPTASILKVGTSDFDIFDVGEGGDYPNARNYAIGVRADKPNIPAFNLGPDGFSGGGFSGGLTFDFEGWAGGSYVGQISLYQLGAITNNRGLLLTANGSLRLPWADSPHIFMRSTSAGASRPQIVLQGNQAGATDRCVTVGTEVVDASVNAAARLLSVRTELAGQGGVVANEKEKFAVLGSGLCLQAGTNSSGAPGAATINRPTGVSAVAGGAVSCVITNSLVTTASRVTVTLHADPGAAAARWWVTRAAGGFTLTFSGAVAGVVPFSWEVSEVV